MSAGGNQIEGLINGESENGLWLGSFLKKQLSQGSLFVGNEKRREQVNNIFLCDNKIYMVGEYGIYSPGINYIIEALWDYKNGRKEEFDKQIVQSLNNHSQTMLAKEDLGKILEWIDLRKIDPEKLDYPNRQFVFSLFCTGHEINRKYDLNYKGWDKREFPLFVPPVGDIRLLVFQENESKKMRYMIHDKGRELWKFTDVVNKQSARFFVQQWREREENQKAEMKINNNIFGIKKGRSL